MSAARRVRTADTGGQYVMLRLINERVGGTGALRWAPRAGMIKKATVPLTYPAAISAARHGESYAQYIERSTREHVARGHYSHDHAMSATLGDMLRGNDGE